MGRRRGGGPPPDKETTTAEGAGRQGPVQVGVRVLPDLWAAVQDRASKENVTPGFLIAYAFTTLLELERNGVEDDDATLVAWARERAGWVERGDVARWALKYATPDQARRIVGPGRQGGPTS